MKLLFMNHTRFPDYQAITASIQVMESDQYGDGFMQIEGVDVLVEYRNDNFKKIDKLTITEV